MSKWKILGVQTKIEWYDIKTKIKLLLRKITYSSAFQELICWIFIGYIKLVFVTSKKIYVNPENFRASLKNKQPLIVAIWHNRLMLCPFFIQKASELYANDCQIISLASRHGDGQFISKIMLKFGGSIISGSTRDGRKSSRGIDIGSFRDIFRGLKNGNVISLTPDGPRGPSQKINGEIVNIARISQSGILPISYSASRFKKLRTWDKFVVPLPFSTLCFYYNEEPIYVAKDASEEEMKQIENRLAERMNFVQEKSQEIALTQSHK